jgi:hypothetical protein
VNQTGVVAWLAVRELWISFRLLALLTAYVGVGAVVALLPGPEPSALERLAIGLAAATIVGSGIAAGSLGTERALGRAGWLVTRSITRGTLLIGWFIALAGISLVGLAAAASLGWLAASTVAAPSELGPFATVVVGVAATGLAAVAVGLLLGSLLGPRRAIVAAIILGVAVGAAAYVLLPATIVPLSALAELQALERPVAAGVQGAGVGLAVTAVALVLARLALGRADL